MLSFFEKMQKDRLKRKWLLLAPLGLTLVGMGLSFVAEAAALKQSGASTINWVLAGTGALVVFNSGLCLFGEAIISRVRWLQLNE